MGDSEDAPGEEDDNLDADGDVDMDDTPLPASKKQNKFAPSSKGKPVKGVEEKEMELAQDDDDDEELSELDSDAEGEPDETGIKDDETGENGGEDDEELEEDEDEDEEDEEDDSDEATPATGSRGSTPDLSRLTKRQRGSLGDDYLQLPMGECERVKSYSYASLQTSDGIVEPQVKKHLTAEEYAMRRAEMARRRKNLSEKRNEEEKVFSSDLLAFSKIRTDSLFFTTDGYHQQTAEKAGSQTAWSRDRR